MPRKQSKRLGVGAECSVLVKFIHPSRLVSQTIINPKNNQRLERLLAIREEKKKVHGKEMSCIIFRHDDFENIELYCIRRWVKVDKEGPETQFFEDPQEAGVNVVDCFGVTSSTSRTDGSNVGENINKVELPVNFESFQNNTEDIMMMRNMGFDVDDDNDPIPENVPEEDEENRYTTSSTRESVANSRRSPGMSLVEEHHQQWGWDGFDNRKRECFTDSKAHLKGLSGIPLQGMGYVGMFEIFLGHHLVEMIITESNKVIDGTPIVYGEFQRFLGIQLFMATTSGGGFNRRSYWPSHPACIEHGAQCRFNDYMSYRPS